MLVALGLLWWIDSFRVRLRTAGVGFVACLVGLSGMSLAFPQHEWEGWFGDNYVSKFSRSGVSAISGLMTQGYLESDATVTDRLKTLPEATCAPARKPPHIILVHDESSFDIRVAPGVKVPAGYGNHFRSFDGKQRHFITEGAGGPSWYTEYNVLAGLSARSFGRFAYYVTQIAAGRVERGLPTALRRCGYRTFSIYPALGAFMSAKSFQTTTGVQKFVDQDALGTNRIEPDQFYYDAALRMIARERDKGPMFLFVYLAQNHWPWDYRWRPDLMPEWKKSGKRARRRRVLAAAGHELPRLCRPARAARARLPRRVVPAGPLRRPSAGFCLDPARAVARRGRRQSALDDLRSPLLHDLLRDRRRSTSSRSISPPRSTRSRAPIFR